jgi:cytochrome c-type biogenesis protein CcmH/NrfG
METTPEQSPAAPPTPQLLALALHHHQNGRLAEAKQTYLAVLAAEPDNFDALHLLGVLAHQVGNHEMAVELIEKAVRQNGEQAAVFNNLGEAYKGAKRLDEAVRCYRKALEINPELAEVCSNLGNALRSLDQLEEAEEAFRQAIELKPDFVLAHFVLGTILREHGQLPEAERAFEEVLRLNPDFTDAAHALGLLQLLRGDYQQGLSCLGELAAQLQGASPRRQALLRQLHEAKCWQGEPLSGSRLLLVTGQRASENLMMMRYLPRLKELAPGRLVVYSTPHLARVFQHQGVADEVIPMTSPLPAGKFDCYAHLMSLPHLLGAELTSLPASAPYLTAPPELRPEWRDRLATARGLKVGICWASGKLTGSHAKRSLALKQLEPLLEAAELTLVNLQKGTDAGQLQEIDWPVLDFMNDCRDFLDTAALIGQLDLVISVDTAVAHLAGALGKPVWLLNCFASDWPWMLERNDSPWYPSLRIYRQSQRGQWDAVVAEVVEQLALFAALSA